MSSTIQDAHENSLAPEWRESLKDPIRFEALVRRVHSKPFSNPLEFGPVGMLCYRQGSFDLVRRDMELVLPKGKCRYFSIVRISVAGAMCDSIHKILLEHVEEFEALSEREGLKRAFALRYELVNFKKLCLRLMHEFRLLEKDLHQMVSFFFVEGACEAMQTHKWCPEKAADYKKVYHNFPGLSIYVCVCKTSCFCVPFQLHVIGCRFARFINSAEALF